MIKPTNTSLTCIRSTRKFLDKFFGAEGSDIAGKTVVDQQLQPRLSSCRALRMGVPITVACGRGSAVGRDGVQKEGGADSLSGIFVRYRLLDEKLVAAMNSVKVAQSNYSSRLPG
jgi:hypothetical protein